MSERTLPEYPNLEHLKAQAKGLHRERSATDPAFALSDAQFAVARQYGFPSWPKLRREVLFRRFLAAIKQRDEQAANQQLASERWLATYPDDGRPTALHWAAWHGLMSPPPHARSLWRGHRPRREGVRRPSRGLGQRE